uniref:Uncharacterized protein n=1 Tax=Siphoviridae sp. ctRGj11 TaxID=2827868 RepID=A0A8S5SJQ9_9CAUD|nr:MAG TPA: hypothetical protein [Siphoviridae sp. ctRGj11]
MIGVVYRTRVRPIAVVVGWRDAIGGPFVCVAVGRISTYCTVSAAARGWRTSFVWACFLGPWSYVWHRRGMGVSQLAFRLCSMTVRTVGLLALKNTYGNLA